MPDPRIVFAGTPDFALASLEALVAAGLSPAAVLTQPDRPAGRGKKLTASPVKRFALEQGIEVMQPKTLRDDAVVTSLAAIAPDVLIVAAYGLILPQAALDVPANGCLNVHASLLPRWRGAAPIQAAIREGDTETGISLMAMTAGLDCGPVFVRAAVDIGERQTAGELHDVLAKLGGDLLVANLANILDGNIDAVDQDESKATYAGKVATEDAKLDWRLSGDALARCVRAYNPVPGAWFEAGDQRIKCWQAESGAGIDAPPGTVVGSSDDGVVVACGSGTLRMQSLQRPGKRPVTAREFAARLDLTGSCLL